MTTHTPQPKPAWLPDDDYPEYEHIVKSWGYEITDAQAFGSYQGDIVYLLKDGDRHGLVVIGYGSCSGCDALEAATPYGNNADWSPLIELAAELKRDIHWENTHKALMEWANTAPENHWWAYDDDMIEWLNRHGAKLARRRWSHDPHTR